MWQIYLEGVGVMGVQGSQKWRELLGKIIKDPHEKQRVANELGVSVITLTRWVSGESTPRTHNFRLLLKALPEHRDAFLDVLPDDFSQSVNEKGDGEEADQEIPSVFYARVLNAHCNLPRILHFGSMCDVILQQALKQLDPNRVGMEITVVQCMYPALDGKIHSLREGLGRGTPPWNRELEQRTLFLGAESLAGYVVSSGRQLAIPSRQEGLNLFPVQWVEWEESAMAYPLMMADRIAGCLLVSSSQSGYFLSQARQKLVQQYAELLLVAFDPDDFYDLNNIDLGRMPSYEVQRSYLGNFRQRVADVMIRRHLDVVQAEHEVWQQIEDELLHIQLIQDSKKG
jgi:transcriptional regulator with XRE-family HTH domain